ncbi:MULTISPECIES: GntR family transcriptional regulator [unclassified Amycolatopsis]|uniref:GntR family transcriptional regulator n=1 Tax=unclassified Amycolatopsis TaxID=2618356 RepID=UPI00106E57E9|nr:MULTISPECIES: GntR family transcriptional regulator [unclassified Amycolatopsis]
MGKRLLRGELIEEITARVLDGRFPAETRINEVHLANELGVSRTPLREALIGLADRGLLVVAPGRGFLVAPLDPQEARRLYPLIAELEALALRWTSPLELASLPDALDRISDEIADSCDLPAADDRWHALLTSRCGNPHLLRLIEQTKPLLKRYETAYFGGRDRVAESVAEHREIAAALRANDLPGASALLVRNWVKALTYLQGS